MTGLTESDLKAFQQAVYKDYGIMLDDTLLYQEAFNLLQFIKALIKFDREDKEKTKENKEASIKVLKSSRRTS